MCQSPVLLCQGAGKEAMLDIYIAEGQNRSAAFSSYSQKLRRISEIFAGPGRSILTRFNKEAQMNQLRQ